MSVARAHGLVTEALREVTVGCVDELRRLESERLDEAQAALWPAVQNGGTKAVDAFVRISARRVRLLGLDIEPSAVEVIAAYADEFTAIMARWTR